MNFWVRQLWLKNNFIFIYNESVHTPNKKITHQGMLWCWEQEGEVPFKCNHSITCLKRQEINTKGISILFQNFLKKQCFKTRVIDKSLCCSQESCRSIGIFWYFQQRCLEFKFSHLQLLNCILKKRQKKKSLYCKRSSVDQNPLYPMLI